MATSEEIAWAAGIFEGEGCIHAVGVNSVSLTIHMTDRDVLERFRAVVGTGTLHPVNAESRRGNKPIWRWSIAAAPEVRRILRDFAPWFGERRRNRAIAMLARLRDNIGSPGTRTHCIRGHAFAGTNLIITRSGKRACRECRNILKRESYARLKARVR